MWLVIACVCWCFCWGWSSCHSLCRQTHGHWAAKFVLVRRLQRLESLVSLSCVLSPPHTDPIQQQHEFPHKPLTPAGPDAGKWAPLSSSVLFTSISSSSSWPPSAPTQPPPPPSGGLEGLQALSPLLHGTCMSACRPGLLLPPGSKIIKFLHYSQVIKLWQV